MFSDPILTSSTPIGTEYRFEYKIISLKNSNGIDVDITQAAIEVIFDLVFRVNLIEYPFTECGMTDTGIYFINEFPNILKDNCLKSRINYEKVCCICNNLNSRDNLLTCEQCTTKDNISNTMNEFINVELEKFLKEKPLKNIKDTIVLFDREVNEDDNGEDIIDDYEFEMELIEI